MRLLRSIIVFVMMTLPALAAEWRNADSEHYLGGIKVSNGYLQGKVVMVYRWGASSASGNERLPRVEEIWQSFKSKQFVIICSHNPEFGSTNEVRKLIKSFSLTCPVYADVGLKDDEPRFKDVSFVYVVNELGSVVYKGNDINDATEAAVIAITDMESPSSVWQFMAYLDYELENLPGRAYLRMLEFKKKHPKAAKDYADKFKALSDIPDIKKLAELVDTARRAKDSKVLDGGGKNAAKKKRLQEKVSAAIAKFTSLKEAEDSRVKQEAKNALADLIRLQIRF